MNKRQVPVVIKEAATENKDEENGNTATTELAEEKAQ